VLQDIVVMMESNAVEGNSQKPQFTIGLITDGEDTEKGVNPDIIRNVINDLSNREIIRSAVIIGLVNNQLSKETLEHIRKELGFHQAIPCSQETNKDIRRAFLIASESTVRAYKGD
jgi:hypothetical protein